MCSRVAFLSLSPRNFATLIRECYIIRSTSAKFYERNTCNNFGSSQIFDLSSVKVSVETYVLSSCLPDPESDTEY